MHQVRLPATVAAPQLPQHAQLGERVDTAARHRQRLPTKTRLTQTRAVFARRREQDHLVATCTQRLGQRALEIEEKPVGVGKQQDAAPAVQARRRRRTQTRAQAIEIRRQHHHTVGRDCCRNPGQQTRPASRRRPCQQHRHQRRTGQHRRPQQRHRQAQTQSVAPAPQAHQRARALPQQQAQRRARHAQRRHQPPQQQQTTGCRRADAGRMPPHPPRQQQALIQEMHFHPAEQRQRRHRLTQGRRHIGKCPAKQQRQQIRQQERKTQPRRQHHRQQQRAITAIQALRLGHLARTPGLHQTRIPGGGQPHQHQPQRLQAQIHHRAVTPQLRQRQQALQQIAIPPMGQIRQQRGQKQRPGKVRQRHLVARVQPFDRLRMNRATPCGIRGRPNRQTPDFPAQQGSQGKRQRHRRQHRCRAAAGLHRQHAQQQIQQGLAQKLCGIAPAALRCGQILTGEIEHPLGQRHARGGQQHPARQRRPASHTRQRRQQNQRATQPQQDPAQQADNHRPRLGLRVEARQTGIERVEQHQAHCGGSRQSQGELAIASRPETAHHQRQGKHRQRARGNAHRNIGSRGA